MNPIKIYLNPADRSVQSGWASIAANDYSLDHEGYVASFTFGGRDYVLVRRIVNPGDFARQVFDSARSANSTRTFLATLAPFAISSGALSEAKNEAEIAKAASNAKYVRNAGFVGLAIGSVELLSDIFTTLNKVNKPEGYYNVHNNLEFTNPVKQGTEFFKFA